MPSSFFKEAAPPEIYTLPLHAALPISQPVRPGCPGDHQAPQSGEQCAGDFDAVRSEEHTSELQSPLHLLCPLLFLRRRRPRRSTLFPYTPLFRSPSRYVRVAQVIIKRRNPESNAPEILMQ